MGALSGGELARKVVHMGVGLIAFAVPILGPQGSALCALGAVLFNLFVLPRIGGKQLWRRSETERGQAIGIILYPVTVLLLILLFWRRLDVAMAVWGILAFGDGMASVVGMAFGRTKLPWNPDKSWLGSLAYFVFGTLGATVLMWWFRFFSTLGWTVDFPFFLLAICAAAALFAAALESLPQGLDDNLGVPLLTGLVLYGLVLSEGHWGTLDWPSIAQRAAIGAAVNLALALAAYRVRGVDRSGAIAGFLLGTTIWACLDWRGFSLLLAFFVLGTGTTKFGYEKKAKAKLAQEKGGRRGAKNAVANTGAAALAAVFALITPIPQIYLPAFAAAFATAAGDTVSSELGQLWGKRTFLITTLRLVPRGTEGAVSLEGTLAGLAASALIAFLGHLVGLYPLALVIPITLAAFLGCVFESVLGATLEKKALLDNEAVNFLNTLVGALLAGLYAAFRR